MSAVGHCPKCDWHHEVGEDCVRAHRYPSREFRKDHPAAQVCSCEQRKPGRIPPDYPPHCGECGYHHPKYYGCSEAQDGGDCYTCLCRGRTP